MSQQEKPCHSFASTSLAPPTSVDEENLSNLGLPSSLFALFRLVPPQLIGHLNRDHRALEQSREALWLDNEPPEAALTLEQRPIP